MPRPPSLHLPAPVRDLSALRTGDRVLLHFTAPSETTDRQPLLHRGQAVPLTASVCRVQGAACQGTARLSVLPGQAVSTEDRLPPPLLLGPSRAVAYRVRVENAAGRDAGLSREALAAAGAAPEAVTGLAGTTVAEGIRLTWQAARDGSGPVQVEAVTENGGTGAGTRLLQLPPGDRGAGGAIDPTPAAGARVTYRVYRQRDAAVGGQVLPLRSESATVTVVRAADVFAPAPPSELLAVAFSSEAEGSTVSLSWTPNSEPDLAGYYVYRAEGAGPFTRLTGRPVAGVSFQDAGATGLRAGQHVRYAVSAVDRDGNESRRSAVTELDVR